MSLPNLNDIKIKPEEFKERRLDRSEYETNLIKDKFAKHGKNWIERIEPRDGGLFIKDPMVIPEPPIDRMRIKEAIRLAMQEEFDLLAERILKRAGL